MKKPTYQFQNLSSSELPAPIRETFMEAWNDMYEWVKRQLDSGGMSYQVLETTIWIEFTDATGCKLPIYFYDARDRAIGEFGWSAPQ